MRIFDRGLKYQQNPMSLKDAQLSEQMRYQLQGICSVFRVPMAMVQDLTNGTYANSEQQDLWLAKHTITPICTNTEGVLRHRLFARRPEYFAKFNLDGLLRGDYKTRAEGDATLVRAGIINRNESRGHFDYNPAPGLEVYLSELNLGTVVRGRHDHGPRHRGPAETAGHSRRRRRHAAATGPTRAAGGRPARPLHPRRRRLHPPPLGDATARRAARTRRPSPSPPTKLAPLAEAYPAAGLAFDSAGFVAQALAGDAPGIIEKAKGAST